MDADYFSLFYWSFFAVSVIIALITKTFNKLIKPAITKNKWIQIIIDGRVVPILLGSLMGVLPGVPHPEMIDAGPSWSAVLYFATAGITSIWVYSLFEKIFREFLPEKIKSLMGLEKQEKEE